MAFARVTQTITNELKGIVGEPHVLVDEESLARYGEDETEDLSFSPEVVVRPNETSQVSALLRLAGREKIPLTPRAGGTGLSGGALPVHGGILLSVERIYRILEIDRANLVAVVEFTPRAYTALRAYGP